MNKKRVVGLSNEVALCSDYFFKYAFPCARVKVELDSLSLDKYEELEEIFFSKGFVDKEVLEKIFVPAFVRIKRVADRMGKDYWDMDVLKEYWINEHNIIIDSGEGMYGSASERFKNLCKIHEAEVVGVVGDRIIVKYGNKERIVSDFLVSGICVGDKVRIHYGFAVEKV